jgi:hypothetical protein
VLAKADQIAAEYGRMPPGQCDVAFVELKKFGSNVTRDLCCGLPCHSDEQSPINKLINKLGNLESALRSLGALASNPRPSYVHIDDIIDELEAKRPVCARLKLNNPPAQGHFVALVGYRKGSASTFIFCSDPINGPLRLPVNGPTLADLRHPSGTFTNAYFTQ